MFEILANVTCMLELYDVGDPLGFEDPPPTLVVKILNYSKNIMNKMIKC